MSKVIDMVGFRSGHLVVVSFDRIASRREYFWNCICDCGKETSIRGIQLRRGTSKSCGCIHGVAISDPITRDQLKQLLHYNPLTGLFSWLVTTRKTISGANAGTVNALGYIQISIGKKLYLAHTLAVFYMTGKWSAEIDHVDANRANNKWENLRECEHRQNLWNSRRSKRNTSGFKGVSRHVNGRFRAYIQGQHLGVFDSAEAAASAYDVEARRRFSVFARLNGS